SGRSAHTPKENLLRPARGQQTPSPGAEGELAEDAPGPVLGSFPQGLSPAAWRGGAVLFCQAGGTTMVNFLGLFGVGYLAAAGVATTAAVVGRGLVRAARSAVSGNLREAAVETLGALAAPVALSYAATSALVMDVIGGAADLVRPVFHE